jgi:ribosomal protein S18 acetylase RimI-like enzyme
MSIELRREVDPLLLPLRPTLRPVRQNDREGLVTLLRADGLFTSEERSVALELIDGALAEPGGEYRVTIAELGGRLNGYVCYGPTPMTEGTWDLYWVAVHPESRGQGVARLLIESMEAELKMLGARLVRVETSLQDGYGAARAFYERLRYPVVAHICDFYKPGDDLLVMCKRL